MPQSAGHARNAVPSVRPLHQRRRRSEYYTPAKHQRLQEAIFKSLVTLPKLARSEFSDCWDTRRDCMPSGLKQHGIVPSHTPGAAALHPRLDRRHHDAGTHFPVGGCNRVSQPIASGSTIQLKKDDQLAFRVVRSATVGRQSAGINLVKHGHGGIASQG